MGAAFVLSRRQDTRKRRKQRETTGNREQGTERRSMKEEEPKIPPRREIEVPVENFLFPLFFALCFSAAYFLLRGAFGGKLALWLFAPTGLLLLVLLVGTGNLIMGLSERLKREK